MTGTPLIDEIAAGPTARSSSGGPDGITSSQSMPCCALYAASRLAGRGWITLWLPSLRGTPEFKDLLTAYDKEEAERRQRFGAA